MLASPSPPGSAIALIGAGPRGTSLIERIGANLDDPAAPWHGHSLDVHVIDDAASGAGSIWRTDQTRELCMNTLSHAVTLFTEASSTVAGPVRPGPTLYEWSVLALHADFPSDTTTAAITSIPAEHQEAFARFPARAGFAADYRAELEQTVPESHPSRALYGEYLAWAYERAVAALPSCVQVVRHRTRALDITRRGEREHLLLADGTIIQADAVILATGWMPRAATASERELTTAVDERPELTWVRPESPVKQDLEAVAPGSDIIVRGLGMGFFDTMALLTIGRGGEFLPDPTTISGLRYAPSGREPILHATSHRGVPFRAKSLYRSLPPKPAQRLLRAVDWQSMPRPIDFNRALWPRIVADAHLDYLETLHRMRSGALPGGVDEARRVVLDALDAILTDPSFDADDLDAAPSRLATAVAPLVPDAADRFDLIGEMHPAERTFASPEEYDAWVFDRTAADLKEAELARDSPMKAGLWSISAARAVASTIGTNGGFDYDSRATGYRLLMSLGGMVGSGPPAFRNRQLLALADAGLVHFIGPAADLTVEQDGFSAASDRVAESRITSTTLIDAWMHAHDITATDDPLAHSLLAAGRARPFNVVARDGAERPTASFDIDAATGILLHSDGTVDPAVHVAGIPVDDLLHGTIISPMPGTDPPMLRETDRVARSALTIAARAGEANASTDAAHSDEHRTEVDRTERALHD